MKRTAIFLLFIVSTLGLTAQIAWFEPADPSPGETVTLTYNSSEGNEALADYTGIVYLHTGVITQNSIDGGDSARGDYAGPMSGVVRPLLRWSTQFTPHGRESVKLLTERAEA